jgi:hypothetical protein
MKDVDMGQRAEGKHCILSLYSKLAGYFPACAEVM